MVDGERHESPLVTVLGGAPSCVYPRRHLPEELCFFFYQFPRATAFCEPNRSAAFLALIQRRLVLKVDDLSCGQGGRQLFSKQKRLQHRPKPAPPRRPWNLINHPQFCHEAARGRR